MDTLKVVQISISGGDRKAHVVFSSVAGQAFVCQVKYLRPHCYLSFALLIGAVQGIHLPIR